MCPAAGRTRAAGVRAAEVVGDSVYGHASQLRQWLESQAQAYVLAVPGHEYVGVGHRQVQVQDIQAGRPAAEWQPWGRYLLCRRSREDPARPQAYLVLAPQGCPLQTLVQVAGTRGCIENSFEAAQGEVGLDAYEVRSATGWYRYITLALYQFWLHIIPATHHCLAWLDWKRSHQWVAQLCHYLRCTQCSSLQL